MTIPIKSRNLSVMRTKIGTIVKSEDVRTI